MGRGDGRRAGEGEGGRRGAGTDKRGDIETRATPARVHTPPRRMESKRDDRRHQRFMSKPTEQKETQHNTTQHSRTGPTPVTKTRIHPHIRHQARGIIIAPRTDRPKTPNAPTSGPPRPRPHPHRPATHAASTATARVHAGGGGAAGVASGWTCRVKCCKVGGFVEVRKRL